MKKIQALGKRIEEDLRAQGPHGLYTATLLEIKDEKVKQIEKTEKLE